MARVTTEDCAQKVQNRFELVMVAAERAKNILAGAVLTIDKDNDKPSVIALREIAAGRINTDELKSNIISSFQKNNRVDEAQEENIIVRSSDEDMIYDEEGLEINEDNFSTEENLYFSDNIDHED